MESGLINVRIAKINSPSDFHVTFIPENGVIGEAGLFQAFSFSLNEFFEDDQTIQQSFQAKEGHVYAGKRMKDGLWYRVKVLKFLDRRCGLSANCFFLDKGVVEAIPIKCLRIIPSSLKHTRIPYQVKQCCLYGIKPLTMALSPAGEPVMQSCRMWDSSVKIYMSKIVEHSPTARVKNMGMREDGYLIVNLYVDTLEGNICLNDHLVQNEYATVDSSDSEDMSDSVSVGSTDSMFYTQSSDSSQLVSSPEKIYPENKSRMHQKFAGLHAELQAEMDLAYNLKPVSKRAPATQGKVPAVEVASDAICQAASQGHQSNIEPGRRNLKKSEACEVQEKFTEISANSASVNDQATLLTEKGEKHVQKDNATTLSGNAFANAKSSPVRNNSAHGNTLFPYPGSSMFRMPSSPTALDYFKRTVPKPSMVLSDSETSHMSDSTLRRNIKLKTEELGTFGHYENDNGTGNISDISMDSNLLSYDTLLNRSLAEIGQSLKGRMPTLNTDGTDTFMESDDNVDSSEDSQIIRSKSSKVSSSTSSENIQTKILKPLNSPGASSIKEQTYSMGDLTARAKPSPLLVLKRSLEEKGSRQTKNKRVSLPEDQLSSSSYVPSDSESQTSSLSFRGITTRSNHAEDINVNPLVNHLPLCPGTEGPASNTETENSQTSINLNDFANLLSRSASSSHSTLVGSSNFKSCESIISAGTVGNLSKSASDIRNLDSFSSSLLYVDPSYSATSDDESVASGSIADMKSTRFKETDLLGSSNVTNGVLKSADSSPKKSTSNMSNLDKQVAAEKSKAPHSCTHSSNRNKISPVSSLATHSSYQGQSGGVRSGTSSDNFADNIMSDILSLDPNSFKAKPRRPKLAHKAGKHGKEEISSGKVSFTVDDLLSVRPEDSRQRAITPTATSSPVNPRNTALKPILKKAASPAPIKSADTSSSSLDLSQSPRAEASRDRFQFDLSSQSDAEEPWQIKDKIGNKFIANKLLSQLSTSGPQKRPQLASEPAGVFGSSYRPPDGVFVEGNMVLKPAEKLDDVRIHPEIIKILKEKGFVAPQLIQAYSWPVILRGRDLIGIASRSKAHIMAYLAPLLTQLLEAQPYPPGGGPILVVICSTWRRAKDIQGICEGLLGDRTRPRVMTIYGGGCEENYNIPLIEGCEILITTPHCLQRKLDKFIYLTRLCHLVIDEAENVMSNFIEQVKCVMNSYKEVLKRRGSVTMSRQLMLFGSRWTRLLESFCESYMVEPTLIFASQFEASVYSGASHYIKMILRDQGLDKLVDLVRPPMTTTSKVIVFTANDKEASIVFRTLKSQCIYVLLATKDTDLIEVLKEWNQQRQTDHPVLVCTDEVVFDLCVTDANIIIHYGMAPSKTTFGNRMGCARKYYRHLNGPPKPENAPISHIFVTKDCGEMVLSLEEMLTRSKSKIPHQLKQMIAGMYEGKEECNTMPLCYYVKAFGTCKIKSHCDYRHRIKPDLDKRRLLTTDTQVPNQGEVKVLVTFVHNATKFYVRVLEHRALDGSCKQLDQLYNALNSAMQGWFSRPENRIENGPVQYGDMCSAPESFSRVQVLEKGNNENYATERHKRIKIFYVDEGRTRKVEASSLLKLPDPFKVIPFQAVETYLCRISPVDSDTDWVPRADLSMVDQVKDKELWGKIVLSLGGTLWLDPLVGRVYHKSIKVTTTNTQIRTSLIRHGYAIENPKHLELLYELCKDKIKLPDYSKSVLDPEPVVESLSEIHDEETNVYMAACESPGHFYLQLVDNELLLESLMNKIDNEMKSTKCFLNTRNYKPGAICLARYSNDNRWNRGRVLSILDEETAEVFYVDYGEKEDVKRHEMRDIPDGYLKLPFQAIECCLPGAAPIDGCWKDIDGDALYDMTQHFNGDRRTLFSKVVGTEPAQFTGSCRYQVDLVYHTCFQYLNILQELVRSKHTLTNRSEIQLLFPDPKFDDRNGTQTDQVLIQTCKSLYNEENPLMIRKLIHNVKTLLETLIQSEPEDVNSEAVMSVWNIVHYRGNDQHNYIQMKLLPSLCQVLKKCTVELRNVLDAGFVRHLSTQICRNPVEEMKLCCLKALKDLAHFPDVAHHLTREDHVEAVIINIKETESVQVICATVDLISQASKENNRMLDCVRDQKGIDVIYRQTCKHKDHQELCLAFSQFLFVLAECQTEEFYSDFKKEGLLKFVVDITRETTNTQVILWTSRLMHRLSERCRKKKTLILEAGYVPVLKNLSVRFPSLTLDLGDLWDQVLTSLDVKAPREHLSGDIAVVTHGKLSSNSQRTFTNSCFPPVCWCQNSFRVVLSIKLRGVQEKTLTYTENSVHFKATQDGKCYAFDFQLYDTIIPSKCREEVRGSEVLVQLRKEQKGRWSRLLNSKEKPGFLTIDYERFQDSSSDQDVDEDSDENLFALKRSSKGKFLPSPGKGYKKAETRPPMAYSGSDSEDSFAENQSNSDSDEYNCFKL